MRSIKDRLKEHMADAGKHKKTVENDSFKDKIKERFSRFEKITDKKGIRKYKKPFKNVDLEEFLQCKYVKNGEGKILEIKTVYDEDFLRGGISLKEAIYYTDKLIKFFGINNESEKFVFFDLETTGLSGGSGNFAFLTGVGKIQNGKFYLKQYFLEKLSGEKLMLEEYLKFSKNQKGLFSFNGKSYDLPLLKNRFILSRIVHDLREFEHFDLLHISRKLYKGRFDSCSLKDLEVSLLNVNRTDDIPGSLIPETYFKFIRNGEVEPIKNIINHNREDILNMLFIAGISRFLPEVPAIKSMFKIYSLL